ncbi:MAG TPA: hypothetical protein V6D08_06275 [Candidatus Obscuribacterales bacterium]
MHIRDIMGDMKSWQRVGLLAAALSALPTYLLLRGLAFDCARTCTPVTSSDVCLTLVQALLCFYLPFALVLFVQEAKLD